MLRVVVGIAIVAASACGRLGFDERAEGDGGVSTLDTTVCDELSSLLFCEDFEADSPLTTIEATPPSFVIADESLPYRGLRSLHGHTTRPLEPAWILGGPLPAVMSGELHARWYLYVPAQPVEIIMASVHLLEQPAPNHGVDFSFTTTGVQISCTAAGEVGTATQAVPRDRWTCIQLRIVIDDIAGSVETFIDDVPSAALFGVDTLPAAGYKNVHAGLFAGGATNPMDLWTDELVIATTPIGCD
jgi:hypothetical protein